MTLIPAPDASAAAWLTADPLPWHRLVTFGPAGFERYARLRFIPDPRRPGQAEADAVKEGPSDREQLCAGLEVLARCTATPDDCFFCIWEGWGTTFDAPKVAVPHRTYFLLRGSASALADWAGPEPAFIWPADHAWCLANDVDPHYAGIGADGVAIDQLVATPGLDVVAADPRQRQPEYG